MKKIDLEIKEKTITINRVTKVVKGRRIMSFVSLVVVGDGNGSIGIGKGKSKEVPLAIQKATEKARNRMYKITLKNNTIYHEIIGKHCSSLIFMFPIKEGRGIIAGGVIKAILNVMGIVDVMAKSKGSNNPFNVVRATINGLLSMNTLEIVAAKRGKIIKDII
ncbi:30S ribosomal protein S5 [Candidatus Zinderia endosymbiont of Aphrophora alni]|uniref:30S ribosomal protein S5 n=1 Tax=Candidatus Zinderia endosymbiont of Aphrophora alni TaxID=3077951 RepID=UPI0030CC9A19